MQNLGGKIIEDQLFEEIKKLKVLMRGVKASKSTNMPQIHRIKGLVRFEGEIDKGISSLYMSPYAEWIEDFDVATTTEEFTKNGLKLVKPSYDDFSLDEIGFYIYGKNLDQKEIIRWFNKNMIPVNIHLLLFLPTILNKSPKKFTDTKKTFLVKN
jgi:hypothetical protein